MVRWIRWHCPPDTGFEIRALAVWGRARYLSVTEAPHNTEFYTWMGKKHFCFFQTAETGNRALAWKAAVLTTTLGPPSPKKWLLEAVDAVCWSGVGLMLIQRRRRWPDIETTMGRRSVFTVWFLCPLSTMRWPFLGRYLTGRRCFSVDPTFCQSLVFFFIRKWYSCSWGICLATARCRANVPDVGKALARDGRMPSFTS